MNYRGYNSSIKRVGVIRGGPSPEYDISIRTGANIIQSVPEKFITHDVFVSKDGEWYIGGLSRTPEKVFKQCDVFINAMHGSYGEDGKLQRLMERFNVPYTGAGSLSSALAMNKILSKRTLKNNGLKVPEHRVVKKEELSTNLILEIFQTFPQPSIIKPVSGGSSLGVFVVRNYQELVLAINEALKISSSVMIEEYIKGKEITCAVLEDTHGDAYSLYPTEIVYGDEGFFDYHRKYSGAENKICPTDSLSFDEKKEIQLMASYVHKILGLRHYSTVDFLVCPRRGVFVIEANSLPGMTKESIYPKSLSAVGIELPEFVEHILELAYNQNNN